MRRGWFPAYRDFIFDSGILTESSGGLVKVWLYCMASASYNHYRYMYGNVVGPGQLITSLKSIAGATNLSPKQVRTNLRRLEKMGVLGKSGLPGRHTLVTMNNWDLKQGAGHRRAEEGQSKDTLRDHQGQDRGNNQELRTKHKKEEDTSLESSASSNPFTDSVIEEQVEFLNEKAGTRHPKNARLWRELFKTLASHGFTPEDCKAVIENRVAAWRGDSKMCGYLRPSTLFKLEKFKNYIGQLTKPPPTKRPPKEQCPPGELSPQAQKYRELYGGVGRKVVQNDS